MGEWEEVEILAKKKMGMSVFIIYTKRPQDNSVECGYLTKEGDRTFWTDKALQFLSEDEAILEIENREWIHSLDLIDGKTSANVLEIK